MRIQSIVPLLGALSIYGGSARAADPGISTAGAAPESHVSVLTGTQVVQILDDTVDWYRTLGTQQQNATQPSDLLILFANRQTADKVVGLAFEIARANAELLEQRSRLRAKCGKYLAAAVSASTANSIGGSTALHSTGNECCQTTADRPGETKTRHRGEAHRTAGRARDGQRQEESSRHDDGFCQRNNPKAAGANALKAQIEAIAATIPTSNNTPPAASSIGAASTTAGSAAASPAVGEAGRADPARYGIFDLGANVLRQRKKIDTIDVIDRHTAALSKTFQKISAPPLKRLEALSARSDHARDPGGQRQQRRLEGSLRGEFDTLAWLFRQTSDILIPLTQGTGAASAVSA